MLLTNQDASPFRCLAAGLSEQDHLIRVASLSKQSKAKQSKAKQNNNKKKKKNSIMLSLNCYICQSMIKRKEKDCTETFPSNFSFNAYTNLLTIKNKRIKTRTRTKASKQASKQASKNKQTNERTNEQRKKERKKERKVTRELQRK